MKMNFYQTQNSMRTQSISRLKRVFLTVIGFVTISLTAFSQVDYEFWFAAPYGNIDHAPQWPEGYKYKIGGRPIYLRLATQDADADVEVSLPALGETVAFLNIKANSTATVDLTEYIDYIQCSNLGDTVENKGLYIRSNALITAYYEIASVLNTDIFSLKGQNALGKEFFAPFQNLMMNDTFHNLGFGDEKQDSKGNPSGGVNDNGVYDPAYSYVVIVATQNNTKVQITPTTPCVGIAKGETKTVLLQRGQTYVVRAIGQNVNSRMSGTHIKSNKPVAVTIGEDSAYPSYFTKSGDCEDYVGDQIVPVEVTGRKYIVVQGQGYEPSAGHQGATGSKNFYEMVAVTATEDNTTVSVDGAQFGSTLQKGETITIELEDPNAIYTFIEANNPIYAFHISGYHCETAGALLPSVEMCTGSYKMGFVRTYGSENDQEFYMNLMVKGNGEKDFLLNNESNSTINNATFQSIEGTDWKVARIYFNQSDLPEGAYFLQNTTSLFHMGMMNSTSHDWGDGQGYRLMGSMYGYFSRFSDNYPSAKIVNNNDTSITVTRGTKVSLLADGGYKFKWIGYMWDGHDWALMDAPYYLNDVNVENPYVKIDALGIYKYVATITTACYDDVERSVIVKIVEPVDLNEIHDAVCYTPELGLNKSASYNLYNLNDTIVGKKGLITGFYVDNFKKFVSADTAIINDYEGNELYADNLTVVNGSISSVANPAPDDEHNSESVGHLVKTAAQDYTNKYVGLSGDQTQKSVWMNYDFSKSPLDLTKGYQFSFDIRYDSTSTGWSSDYHDVYMELVDNEGNSVSMMGTSMPTVSQKDTSTKPAWETLEFDFEPYLEDLGKITSMRIRVYSGNNWYNKTSNYGYYIDNIKRNTISYLQLLTVPEAKDYTITDGDSLYAIVKNHFDVTRTDTTMVYLSVRNPGIEKREAQINDTCVVGNVLHDYNLTRYNYEIGGALVANRLWYWDQFRKLPIENPESFDIDLTEHGSNIPIYGYVDDECADVPGILHLNIYPVPEVNDVETTVCGVSALGGNKGVIKLDDYKKQITTDLNAHIEWYSSSTYATGTALGATTSITVTDGTVFYAKLYNGDEPRCPVYAQLKVKVTSVPAITFDDFSVCADDEDVTLDAKPSGGVYYGDGVTGAKFSPSAVSVGEHKITYKVSKDGCDALDTVVVTVNPEVKATLVNKSGKLDGKSKAQLEATILPNSSYSYTWSEAVTVKNSNELNWGKASHLETQTSLTPNTTVLDRPTYFAIEVTDKTTGCMDSARVLVDVYIPVEVLLNPVPVCAGSDVTISADRVGGNGPYTYAWSFNPTSTKYTMVNDSVVKLNNPQQNVSITVKVTDNGGAAGENVASVTETQVVYPNPEIQLTGNNACQGGDLGFSPTVSGGATPYSYEWTGNTEILKSSLTSQNVLVNTLDNVGSYYLTFNVVDKNSCKAQKDITAVINQKPVVAAKTSKSIACWSDQITLSTSVTVGSTVNAQYEWIAADAKSLEGLSSTKIPNPTFSSNVSGTHKFQVIFTDEKGCKDTSDEVTVRIEPRPSVSIDPLDNLCVSTMGVGLSATPSLPAGSTSATYSFVWSGDVKSSEDNPILDISTPGIKKVGVKVTSSIGCTSDLVEQTFEVFENPIAEIAGDNNAGCASDTITLNANTASPNVSYEWSSVSSMLSTTGSSVQMILPSNTTGEKTSEYPVRLVVTDNKTKCKSSTSKNVVAYRLPEVTINGKTEVCDGGTQVLTPNVIYSNSTNYKVNWFLDTLQLSATNVVDPVFTQTGTGVFNIGVQITDEKGCRGQGFIAIKGLELPTANAGEDRTEEWDTDFTLFGSATGGAPSYTYFWSPEDSLKSNPTLQNPTSNLLETTIFTLEVTDSKGCKGTDEVVITIIGQPLKVQILQRDSLCEGKTVTLEALPSGGTGDYRYKWYNMAEPSIVIGEEKTIDVSVSEPTTYKVELSCVGPKAFDPTSETRLVSVYQNPQISIYGGDEPRVCQGLIKSLVPIVTDGTAPYTYEWVDESSPIAITRESYSFSNSQVTGTQIVTLTVTDAIGCVGVKPIEVTVDALPTVTIDNMAVCAQAEGELIATAGTTGLQPYTYAWDGIDEIVAQGNVAKFTINTEETMTKVVNVTITDDHGCEGFDDAVVTIKPLPSIELDPRYTVCAEADLLLDINPDGRPNDYAITWNDSPSGYKLTQDDFLETKAVFISTKTGTFTLHYTVEDRDMGCPKNGSIEIEVFPAVKLAEIPDQIACASTDLKISAKVVEGNPSYYSWIGSVSPTDEKETAFNFAKEGEYDVTVEAGDLNCHDIKSFTVTVKPNPVVQIEDGSQIKEVDYSSNVELAAEIVTQTTAPYTHSWAEPRDNNIASGANSQKITTGRITKGTTTYYYQVTDKFGCIDVDSIELQTEVIIPQLRRFVDITTSTEANELIDTATNDLTDARLELCEGESAWIMPIFTSGNSKSISSLSYRWSDDEGNVLGTDINLLAAPTRPEVTYYLHVYNDKTGYYSDVTFKARVHQNPDASIIVSPEWNGKFYTAREGKIDNILIDGNPSSEEYGVEFVSHKWTVSPEVQISSTTAQKANIYTTKEIKPLSLTYEVVDQYGCSTTVNRDIEIVNQPIPVIIGNNVCEGATATYHTEVNYPKGSTFYWEVEGGTIVGDPTLSNVQVTWERTENTSLTVSVYPKGDREVENVKRIIYVNPLPDIEIDGKNHVCVGEYAPYEAINNKPEMDLVYSWSVVDGYGAISNITYPVSDMATVLWNKVGKDTVVLHAMFGACTVSDSLPVYIHPVPKADFTYQPTEEVYFKSEGVIRHTDSVFVDKEVAFTNLTKNADNYDFYWDFIGDGVYTENSKDAVYEYDEVGDFTVSLMVVENMWGCKNIVAKPLKVIPNPTCGMTFPNAFTPDLSENNTFYPVYKEGVLESGYELRVYNRWGTLLWSTTDLYDQWDGVYKGSVSKQDVYVYQCKATCEDIDPSTGEHRVLNIKGDVTIIR